MKKRRLFWSGAVLLSMVLTFFTVLPFHLLAPHNFAPNDKPRVVPILREWHGSMGSFILRSGSRIVLDPASVSQLQGTARVFQQNLAAITGRSPAIATASDPGENNFFLTLKNQDSSIGREGYLLDVGSSVTINAHTATGVFYGTRSVLQILRAAGDHASIPKGFARDFPKYKERGFMLDVGRKFVPLNALKDYVRLMAWYKFNDFQLHFNDNAIGGGNSADWKHQYAAFRLNSPAFPGLAARDGSYTQQDILDLQQFAQAYAVTITPEIDTPAHSLALTQYRPDLASKGSNKEFLDLNNPETYTFIDSLWSTFLPWFSASGIHIGVDEYDTHDANQYRNYINHYNDFMRQKGKTARMWGSLSTMKSNVAVNTNIVVEDWNNTWANPIDMTRAGFPIINANDTLLYIVPHANYYHDFLDTRLLYERWEPFIFSLTKPALNLHPNDPHLVGGMFAVWNDLFARTSVDDISRRIEPAMPVIGEKMWSGTVPNTSYTQFEQLVQQVARVPGTHLP